MRDTVDVSTSRQRHRPPGRRVGARVTTLVPHTPQHNGTEHQRRSPRNTARRHETGKRGAAANAGVRAREATGAACGGPPAARESMQRHHDSAECSGGRVPQGTRRPGAARHMPTPTAAHARTATGGGVGDDVCGRRAGAGNGRSLRRAVRSGQTQGAHLPVMDDAPAAARSSSSSNTQTHIVMDYSISLESGSGKTWCVVVFVFVLFLFCFCFWFVPSGRCLMCAVGQADLRAGDGAGPGPGPGPGPGARVGKKRVEKALSALAKVSHSVEQQVLLDAAAGDPAAIEKAKQHRLGFLFGAGGGADGGGAGGGTGAHAGVGAGAGAGAGAAGAGSDSDDGGKVTGATKLERERAATKAKLLEEMTTLERSLGTRVSVGMTLQEQIEKFPMLKGAPVEGAYAGSLARLKFNPLGKVIRHVRCLKCSGWGHSSGDREWWVHAHVSPCCC